MATNQSAFTRGRCTHGNFMLVQQTIKVLHRRKISSLFLKLDISKAFDSVDWAFLLEILSHLGFGTVWRNLIANLLQSASTQVILNGEPGAFIAHQRGLRQGDPLSPMLFILVMDVLNSLFTKPDSEGLLLPLHSTGQRLSLYMTLLFLSGPKKQIYSSQKTYYKFLEKYRACKPTCRRVV